MSHPQGYFEGSKQFQSLIARCSHGVYRPFGDPAGKSTVCEICNSGVFRTQAPIQLRKGKREFKKIVPPIISGEDESGEEFAKTNIEIEENSETEGTQTDLEEVAGN
jgi:hypothetical protein